MLLDWSLLSFWKGIHMNLITETLAQESMDLAMEWGPDFFSHPDDIADLISVAWEMATEYGKGNPGAIVNYARQWVRSKRHLWESSRSVTSDQPTRGRMEKPKWSGFSVEFIPDNRDNPPDFVIAKFSWFEWLRTLDKKNRQAATRMRKGWSNSQLQSLFSVSPARVSQMRRELWESFFEYLNQE